MRVQGRERRPQIHAPPMPAVDPVEDGRRAALTGGEWRERNGREAGNLTPNNIGLLFLRLNVERLNVNPMAASFAWTDELHLRARPEGTIVAVATIYSHTTGRVEAW